MKVVIASGSMVKIQACKLAFNNRAGVEVVSVKAPSGINEQPIGYEETLKGARNRLEFAENAVPNADAYISIENGLMAENGYIDKAIIVIQEGNVQQITYSDGVEFPAEAVEETRKRGFDKWTVGSIMQEQGIVNQADDPHLDLCERSRVDILNEALQKSVKQMGL